MIRCSDRCTDGCVCGAAEMNDEIRPLTREALLDLLADAARTLRLLTDLQFAASQEPLAPNTVQRTITELEEAVNRG